MYHPSKISAVLGALLLAATAFAQEIVLNDVATSSSDIKTMFKNKYYEVVVTSIDWGELTPSSASYVTSVNGEEQAKGTVELDPTDLPSEVQAGTVMVTTSGTKTVAVEWIVDASASSANSTAAPEPDGSTSRNYQAYGAGATLVPLIIILLLAVSTRIVELSLFTGVFVGACMVAGNVNDGFKVRHSLKAEAIVFSRALLLFFPDLFMFIVCHPLVQII